MPEGEPRPPSALVSFPDPHTQQRMDYQAGTRLRGPGGALEAPPVGSGAPPQTPTLFYFYHAQSTT